MLYQQVRTDKRLHSGVFVRAVAKRFVKLSASALLFLDEVYVGCVNGSAARFRWVKAPTHDELTQLVHTNAQRVASFLEHQGLLERDGENNHLASEPGGEGPMDQLLGHSITYRIAVG